MASSSLYLHNEYLIKTLMSIRGPRNVFWNPSLSNYLPLYHDSSLGRKTGRWKTRGIFRILELDC